MVRLKKLIAIHDCENRNDTVVYINGEIYNGDTHWDAIQEYLQNHKLDENTFYLDDVIDRRYKDSNTLDNYENFSLAFGHIVTELWDDEKMDFVDQGKNIFLETSSLQNVTLDKVISAIKQKYPDYEIYDDDSCFRENAPKENYKKLAKK